MLHKITEKKYILIQKKFQCLWNLESKITLSESFFVSSQYLLLQLCTISSGPIFPYFRSNKDICMRPFGYLTLYIDRPLLWMQTSRSNKHFFILNLWVDSHSRVYQLLLKILNSVKNNIKFHEEHINTIENCTYCCYCYCFEKKQWNTSE